MSEHKYEVLAWNLNLFSAESECFVNKIAFVNTNPSGSSFFVFHFGVENVCQIESKIESKFAMNVGNINTE